MRYRFFFFFFFAIVFLIQGQDNTQQTGTVTYITSQKIYVKFESTENIHAGDTLFINNKGEIIPLAVVENKSSISCVCTPLSTLKINISDKIFAQDKVVENLLVKIEDDTHLPRFNGNNTQISAQNELPEKDDPSDQIQSNNQERKPLFTQKISGRISAASYNNIYDTESNHRMRYSFVMRADNIGNSRFSIDSYITFRHTINEWEKVQNDLSSALKVYALAIKYDISQKSSIMVGRKINNKISSMGAIDGIQFEQGFGNFTFGAILGSRPDYADYSFNPDLFQYGAFLSHGLNANNKFLQSTIGYIEQQNNSKIDRRFIYFQHSSSLLKNLNLFCSAEVSLYENINDVPKNVMDLSNLYVTLRYRATRKLNLSASYDNRKKIQYYETYKSFIDSLIEEETRQGVRANASYRLFKNVTWGVNAGWRFQKSEKNLSKNLNSYLTFNRIPALNIRTTLTANFLQTTYLNSRIFGIRVSREIVPRKLDGDIYYRMVDYQYLNYETATQQNIVGVNFSWIILKKLSLYINYEGTFDDQNRMFNRFYTKIVQRF